MQAGRRLAWSAGDVSAIWPSSASRWCGWQRVEPTTKAKGPLGTSFPTLIYLTLTRLPTVSRLSFRLTRYPSPYILHRWLSLIEGMLSDLLSNPDGCDLPPGYLVAHSMISLRSARTPNSWLAISMPQQARVVWPSLRRNACLPQYIGSGTCQNLESEPWPLMPALLWLPIRESNLFHLIIQPQYPVGHSGHLDTSSPTLTYPTLA